MATRRPASHDTGDADAARAHRRRRTDGAADPGDRNGTDDGGRADLDLPEETFEEVALLEYYAQQHELLINRALSRTSGDGGQAGIITSIELNHFMNHEYFRMDLSPHVNFVTGINGAGKSAVLTALVICLGGKAAATDRGASLKDFIRTGSKEAVITVALRNRGEDAYNPHQYGDAISIERRLRESGQATYVLKGAQGNVVGRTRDHLDAVLDHFAITIDNPLALLSQEVAKRFLAGSRPQDFYAFFLKGTQLDDVHADLDAVENACEQMRHVINGKTRDVLAMKEAVDEQASKVGGMEQQRKLAERVKNLENAIGWALVADKEADLANVEAERAQLQLTADQHRQRLQRAKEKEAQAQARADSLKKDVEATAERQQPYQERLAAAAKSIKAITETTREIKVEASSMERQIAMHDTERARLQRELDELRRRHANEPANRRARLEEQAAAEQAALERIDTDRRENDRQRQAKEVEQDLLVQQAATASDAFQRAKANVRNAHNNIQRLEAQQLDRLRAFGDRTPEVLRAIEAQRGQFRRPVFGPIGRFVRIKDARWATAMQACVGQALLNAFVVYDDADLQTLRRILNEQNAKYTRVYRYRSEADVDTSEHEPAQGLNVASRLLEFDDPRAHRALVDQARIERTVLVESAAAGWALWERRPANVEHVFTIGGQRLGLSRPGRPSGSAPVMLGADDSNSGARQMSYAGSRSDNSVFVDVRQSLVEARAAYQPAVDAERAAQARFTEAQAANNARANELIDLNRTAANLQTELNQRRARLQALQRELSRPGRRSPVVGQALPTDDAVDEKAQSIATRIQEIAHEVAVETATYRDLVRQIEATEARKAPHQAELEAVSRELDAIKKAAEKANQEQEHHLTEAATAVGSQRREQSHLTAVLTQIERADESIKGIQNEIQLVTDQVKVKEPRRAVFQGSYQDESAKLERLKQQLEKSQKVSGRLEDEARTLQEQRASYGQVKRDLKNVTELVNELQDMLEKRAIFLTRYKRFLEVSTRADFRRLLARRGFQGRLVFRHATKARQWLDGELVIRVRPAEHAAMRGTQQLSGGERSFSTISFLTAMWASIECPFRALDEFDVFMDAVNRKTATQMVVNHAKIYGMRQFIIITPLELTSEAVADNVKVHRLGPHK